jgi:hypothetical protein
MWVSSESWYKMCDKLDQLHLRITALEKANMDRTSDVSSIRVRMTGMADVFAKLCEHLGVEFRAPEHTDARFVKKGRTR